LHLAANRPAKGKEKEKKERDEREESKIEAREVLMMSVCLDWLIRHSVCSISIMIISVST